MNLLVYNLLFMVGGCDDARSGCGVFIVATSLDADDGSQTRDVCTGKNIK